MGYLRKDCLNRDLGALQEAVCRLVDFAHPSFGDEAHDNEAIIQDLIGGQAPSRPRWGNLMYVEGTGIIGWACFPLAKNLKWRVLKKAAGVRILGQQFFDRAPQFRV